jgi:hypothetical protein
MQLKQQLKTTKENMKDEILNSLFDAVADELLTKIKTGEAKPADLAVAVKFLKDNNITCLPVDGNSLEELMKTMPFNSEDKLSYNTFES